MRFVDISQVEPPSGWQQRADEALSALRAEILKAEADALASGGDVPAARKSAIRAGLAISSRQRVWRDLASCLADLTTGKCWYSESRNPTSDKNVDHFRPKGRVEEDSAHEGYWWLAFNLENYRYSSQWCNQRRVDDTSGTRGGKGDQFPLCSGSSRARGEDDDIDLEKPELLDPVDPSDWRLLTFRPDGHPTPALHAETHAEEHQRAARSIEVYHLDCMELVNERRILAGRIQRVVQELELLRQRIDDGKVRAVYKKVQIDLLRAIHPASEYSAAARAYARAEIYRLERGQEVKREWLEEILS